MTPRVIGGGRGFAYITGASSSGGSVNFDFTTGVLPGAITFTRPSIGTYFNNAGLLITAGNDAARFNYVGGVACLLIERGATNLLLYSNGFNNGSGWFTGGGSVVTAAQFISPDGTNNGSSLTAGSGFGSVGNYTVTFANAQYTVSAWVKRITGTAPHLFKLSSSNWGGDIVTSGTITRVSATMTTPSGAADVNLQVDAATGTNGIFGAQVETGPAATSYIPTAAAAVTRAADSAVFTIPAGIGHLTYTFDDNSTQLVAVSPGSYTIPTSLNRPNIKKIVGSA